VITAVSTLAVPANALLAWKILGEPVTRKERLAIAAMTVGAGMVVVSSPQQARPAMTVREEAALLTASVAPAIGLLVTLLVTQAG
jgi:drug/metabolite transporter (DMT)-like permease